MSGVVDGRQSATSRRPLWIGAGPAGAADRLPAAAAALDRPHRLAAVTSHPVQYQAPLFRLLARHPRVDLTVCYGARWGLDETLDAITGSGGQAMESLVADGLIAGVLDITTTELADELVGGVLSAGPDRLTVAGKHGVAQVISVGALDMVNFGPPDTVPGKFRDRRFYQHNPTVTLMRTTVEENVKLGAEIARKAAAAKGPTAILLPLRGVSAIDLQGKPFDDPQARAALYDAIRKYAPTVERIELDHHINDTQFAEAAARKLIELIAGARSQSPP